VESLSQAEARRIALVAQGVTRPRPAGRSDVRQIRRVLRTVHLLQLDSVNVLVRAHEMPLWTRLGDHDRGAVMRMLDAGELFEYWGHQASLIPIDDFPLFAWKMDEVRRLAAKGHYRVAREQPDLVERVAAEVDARGEATAGELSPPGSRRPGSWWNLSDTKIALEWLFWIGRVTARRRGNFERVYRPISVLPASVRDHPVPEEEARVELLARAARALGVATERDLMYYFQLNAPKSRGALRVLAERGDVIPVEVEGWNARAWLHRDAKLPRRVTARTLLSPFDPILWERSRALRLFDFHYRIEIYTPAAKRVHGYYVLPFLLDDRLVARVDLKADRAAGVLRVQSAFLEPPAETREVAVALATELRAMASWLGLDDVHAARRGDLAVPLSRALRAGV
jgi:uncharacterized protein YcaQ